MDHHAAIQACKDSAQVSYLGQVGNDPTTAFAVLNNNLVACQSHENAAAGTSLDIVTCIVLATVFAVFLSVIVNSLRANDS